MPGFGHDCYIQIGRESVWGTDVAATRRFNVLSAELNAIRGKVRSNVLTGNRTRSAIYKGPQLGRAVIELEADFEGQLHLWDALQGTGTYGANGGTSSGTNPYTWTFIQRALFNSYSMELVTNIPSGKADQLLGAKLNKLTFSGEVGLDSPPCRIRTEWIGKAATTNVTPTGALSANAAQPIMPGHISTGTFDSGTSDAAGSDRLKSWEITVDNKLAERFYGADTIEEPLADEYADVSYKWTMEFTSKTAIDEYLSNALTAPAFKFASGSASLEFGSGSGYIVTPVDRPVDRWGILTQTFTVEPVHESTYTGLRVIAINTESTIS